MYIFACLSKECSSCNDRILALSEHALEVNLATSISSDDFNEVAMLEKGFSALDFSLESDDEINDDQA